MSPIAHITNQPFSLLRSLPLAASPARRPAAGDLAMSATWRCTLSATVLIGLVIGSRSAFGLFVSPVAFTLSRVPEQWRTLYALNPMVGIIEGFRWSVLGKGATLDLEAVALSVIVTSFALFLGVWYFRRMERSFADVI